MARQPGAVLQRTPWVHFHSLPGETPAGPVSVHGRQMVPTVREDSLCRRTPTLAVPPQSRIQRLGWLHLLSVSPRLSSAKIANFLLRLPKYAALKPLKTKIEFYNGSRIQAFPNSPETIRGEPGVNPVLTDELGYVRDDKELYDAVVFTLATTSGRFIATSTPGSRDSLFYAMCTDDGNFGDFSRHHVTYQNPREPNGPLKREILEKLKRQLATDPWRWRREMEAEFADDEDAWLSFELIRRCINQEFEYFDEGILLAG